MEFVQLNFSFETYVVVVKGGILQKQFSLDFKNTSSMIFVVNLACSPQSMFNPFISEYRYHPKRKIFFFDMLRLKQPLMFA